MKTRTHLIPALIVAIMLVVAVAPLPYGYYQFLRWAVTGVAIFIAVKGYTWKQTWATWLFGAVAVMFNPIQPIDLTREIWQPIDLAVALLFALSTVLLPEPVRIKSMSSHEAKLWHKVSVTILILLILMVIGSASYGLATGQLLPDNPEFTEDEVIAKVVSYLRAEDTTRTLYLVSFGKANYLGKGKWSGRIKIPKGIWYFSYDEKHQTVEILLKVPAPTAPR